MYAAMSGNIECVLDLLKNGANPNNMQLCHMFHKSSQSNSKRLQEVHDIIERAQKDWNLKSKAKPKAMYDMQGPAARLQYKTQ